MSHLIPNPKFYSALKRGAPTHWIKDVISLGDDIPAELSDITGEFDTTVPLYDKQQYV